MDAFLEVAGMDIQLSCINARTIVKFSIRRHMMI